LQQRVASLTEECERAEKSEQDSRDKASMDAESASAQLQMLQRELDRRAQVCVSIIHLLDLQFVIDCYRGVWYSCKQRPRRRWPWQSRLRPSADRNTIKLELC
jgi:hypothetical protein